MTNDNQANQALSFEETEALVNQKLDGDGLTHEEEQKLTESLPHYPVLQSYLSSAQEVITGLSETKKIDVPNNIVDNIMETIETIDSPSIEEASFTPSGKKTWLGIGTIAAAVALLVISVPALNPFNSPDSTQTQLVAQHNVSNSKTNEAETTDVFIAHVLNSDDASYETDDDFWESSEDPMAALIGF